MDLELSIYSLLTGLVIPFIVPILSQAHWSKTTKSLIVLGVSIAGGVVNALVSGNASDIAIVLMSVTTVYQMLNKTGIFDSIQGATSKDKIIDVSDLPETPAEYKTGDIETKTISNDKNVSVEE